MVVCSLSPAGSSSKAVVALHIENSCWQKRSRVSSETPEWQCGVILLEKARVSAASLSAGHGPVLAALLSHMARGGPAWTTTRTRCRALSCSGPLPEKDSLNDCLVSDMPEWIDYFLNAKKPTNFLPSFSSPLGGKCPVQ